MSAHLVSNLTRKLRLARGAAKTTSYRWTRGPSLADDALWSGCSASFSSSSTYHSYHSSYSQPSPPPFGSSSSSSSSSRGPPHDSEAQGRGSQYSHNNSSSSSSSFSSRSPLDQSGPELARTARRLARSGSIGQDPYEVEKTWSAIAFQAQGLEEELSPSDAAEILRAFSLAGVLGKYEAARWSLLSVLQKRGRGQLKARKVVDLWAALDRADVADEASVEGFFKDELLRALPRRLQDGVEEGEADDADAGPEAAEHEPGTRPGPKNTSRNWRRLIALLEASECSNEQCLEVWRDMEATALSDDAGVKSLSTNGMVFALRSAALIREVVETSEGASTASGGSSSSSTSSSNNSSKSTETEPDEARAAGDPTSAPFSSTTSSSALAEAFVERLLQRTFAQARWLDGWSASHAALASAKLGASPRKGYDVLRPTILQRCSLAPPESVAPAKTPSRRSATDAESQTSSPALRQAERVAAALAAYGVHDAEVRDRIAPWLLKPLSSDRFASLARDLAAAGLSDSTSPRIARHVRARLRSSDFRLAARGSEELLLSLTRSYARPGDDE